ncbi:MAG: DUF4197 family protein [Mariprofundaceae bacterium]
MRSGLLAVCLSASLGIMPCTASAGFMDDVVSALNQLGDSAGKNGDVSALSALSNKDISEGLKQALRKGTRISVDYLGHTDGFWKRPEVRIPLPDSLQTPARLLQKAGMGRYADQLHERINRAAEKAVPLAKPIFYDAIRSMSFSDVQQIWKGPDDAATRYFERKTTSKLAEVFSPMVHKELDHSGAVKSYRAFSSQYASLPLVGHYLKDDLDGYVTKQALATMFTVLAREEAKIRRDPAARTTELLRRVFQ